MYSSALIGQRVSPVHSHCGESVSMIELFEIVVDVVVGAFHFTYTVSSMAYYDSFHRCRLCLALQIVAKAEK